ncbi:rod shape-determining protein MreC [Haloimpatiens sp. FM7315]|uniref:rod shape-determining protein MreC n=1 Tax=Haloimpatiens sp. FM7315 TaxID=3298609 RepID=UPI0035A2EBFD
MKFFKKKLTVIIIILSVTFLVLIGFAAKRSGISVVENGMGVTINSIQKFIYKGCYEIKSSVSFLYNFSNVKDENKSLKKENQELKDKLIRYSMLEDENDRLRNVVNYKNQNSEYNYVGADVIAKSGNDYLDGFIINRGKKDGINKRMAVVNSFGLVGQVTSVGDNWALIQTLENENIAVGGYVIGTKENAGIVRGYKNKDDELFAKLQYLPVNSNIKIDDEVVTGLVNVTSKDIEPGVYPKGIKIGKVISVDTDKAKMMKNAVIKLYVDFNKLEELFVVVPKVSRQINN